MENCKHGNTLIWEPHLAGARKCADCGMVKDRTDGEWYLPPLKTDQKISLEMFDMAMALACDLENLFDDCSKDGRIYYNQTDEGVPYIETSCTIVMMNDVEETMTEIRRLLKESK